MVQILSHQNRYLSQNELFPLDRMIIGCPPLYPHQGQGNQPGAGAPAALRDRCGSRPLCQRVRMSPRNSAWRGRSSNPALSPGRRRPRIEKRSVKELTALCKQPLRFKPAETLRAYLAGPQQKFLFTFLRRPGMPPTNNLAEQSLRHLVIFRKICFGTRSDSGLKTHSILPSLVQTARRQAVLPREFLETLLTADTATAQAALYNNSS